MPYKSEKIKIAGTKFDRRIKLTEEDKKEILRLRKEGYSQRKLARAFNVSRRLITYILDPQKLVENKRRRKEAGGSMQYYKNEYNSKKIKETRRYKQKLFVDKKIKLKEKNDEKQ